MTARDRRVVLYAVLWIIAVLFAAWVLGIDLSEDPLPNQ